MTIEEKSNAIRAHCNKYWATTHSCVGCPLYSPFSEVSCSGSDADVAGNYELIMRSQKIQPENAVPAVDKLTRHEQICDEIKALYKRKNADYGDSFHKTFVEEGMAMPRIRLTDKLERFKKLTKSGEQKVNDESVRDTLIDLANYAIMTILELEE